MNRSITDAKLPLLSHALSKQLAGHWVVSEQEIKLNAKLWLMRGN